MKADLSRQTFAKEKHYSAVVMQQGRVQVDADWNEQHAIERHRVETETQDVVGLCGGPEDDAGFEVSLVTNATTDLQLGHGKYYVDGILVENETDHLQYGDQPDFPAPPAGTKHSALGDLGPATFGLVYLDVWNRHITAIDDPAIHEVALGEAETTTRLKTVWQAKVLPLPSVDLSPADATTLLGYLQARDELQSQLDQLGQTSWPWWSYRLRSFTPTCVGSSRESGGSWRLLVSTTGIMPPNRKQWTRTFPFIRPFGTGCSGRCAGA